MNCEKKRNLVNKIKMNIKKKKVGRLTIFVFEATEGEEKQS